MVATCLLWLVSSAGFCPLPEQPERKTFSLPTVDGRLSSDAWVLEELGCIKSDKKARQREGHPE